MATPKAKLEAKLKKAEEDFKVAEKEYEKLDKIALRAFTAYERTEAKRDAIAAALALLDEED